MTGTSAFRQWRVSGRVQGVGFRWFVSRQARALHLSGWVRNLESGEVVVLASGPSDRLDKLRQLIAEGPSGAAVERVDDVTPITSEAPRIPFSIIG